MRIYPQDAAIAEGLIQSRKSAHRDRMIAAKHRAAGGRRRRSKPHAGVYPSPHAGEDRGQITCSFVSNRRYLRQLGHHVAAINDVDTQALETFGDARIADRRTPYRPPCAAPRSRGAPRMETFRLSLYGGHVRLAKGLGLDLQRQNNGRSKDHRDHHQGHDR